MKSLQIYIDGNNLLDIDQSNKGVSLSSEVERVGQFGFIPSNSSLPFSVPKTRRNRAALSLISDVIDIVIRANGIETLKGKAKKTETGDRFNVDAWGTNANWITDLESLTLSGIAEFAGLESVWSGANIDANFTAVGNQSTDPSGTSYPAFAYFPILYRKQLDREWNNEDLLPNMNVWWMVEQGFLSKGWKVQSDFMSKLQFRRLYIPYCWGRFGRSTEYYEQESAAKIKVESQSIGINSLNSESPQTRVVDFDDEAGVGLYDNGGNHDVSTAIYTTPHQGIFGVSVYELNLRTSNAFETDYSIRLKIIAGEVVANATVLPLPTRSDDDFHYWDVPPIFNLVELAAGDEIYIEITIEFTGLGTGYSNSFLIEKGFLQITQEPYYLENDNIVFSEFLPKDLTFIDFLKGLKDCFNLKIVANPFTKIVTIEPRNRWIEMWSSNNTGDGYFDETLTIQNLTRLADQNTIKEAFFDELQRKMKFQYKPDSRDGFLNFIEKENRVTVMEATYQLPSRFETGEQVIENHFFAATVHGRVDSGGGSMYIPVMLAENAAEIADSHNERDYAFTPKIVFYRGVVAGATDDVFWTFRGEASNTYFSSFAVNYESKQTLDWFLSYSDTTVSGTTYAGLFRTYFHRQLYNLTLPYLEVFLKIGMSDFASFNHRANYYYQEKQYLCIGITGFQPLQKSFTKAVLLQNRYPESSDLDNITHEPTAAFIIPPSASEYEENDPCTMPCEGSYVQFSVLMDISDNMEDVTLQSYSVKSFIINDEEHITTNVPILGASEAKNVEVVIINGTPYNYVTDLPDTLQEIAEDESIEGYFTFLYSPLLVEHESKQARFFKVRYPSCWNWSIIIYDAINLSDKYRYSNDKGFEIWGTFVGQGSEWVQSNPHAYYAEEKLTPQNIEPIELCK